jgi:hypothetical protein
MNKETIIKKLTSRKFIVSLIALASGIALLCGADGNTVETVSAALMILIPSLIYCITEGRLDKESINSFRDALDIIETATKRGDDDESS